MLLDRPAQARRDSTSLGRKNAADQVGLQQKTPNRERRHFGGAEKEKVCRNSRRGGNILIPKNSLVDSNSLGRHQQRKEQKNADENCAVDDSRPDSAELHRNEKVLTSDSAIRLPGRSAFYKMYELSSRIGQGNFSDVFLVYHAETGAKLAVKEIDKARMRGKLHFVGNEIALLQNVRHRNICRLLDAYECPGLYFLVFEYAQKGDLFETIKRVGRLCERSAAQITRQIASALAFLHRRQIVHRDLKPENILLCADSTVKLTDFGLACVVLGPLYRVCGTPTYVAPEILTQEGYGVQVDVWSLGIILHICLAGFAPFRCTERAQLFRQIVRARLTFDLPNWNRVTSKAKQLIQSMLIANPDRRLTADQVTTNEWILAEKKDVDFPSCRIDIS